MKLHTLVIATLLSAPAWAVEFTTKNQTPAEKATITALQALQYAHDLKRFEFTDKVIIEAKTIPHSHPVLTLHTRHAPAEHRDLLLSTYIHEQLHWFLSQNPTKMDAAIADLRRLFPTMPVGYPEGADSEVAGYAHLIVCSLEISAVRELLSARRANEVLAFWQKDHYTYIYQQVATRGAEIEAVLRKHQLQLPNP